MRLLPFKLSALMLSGFLLVGCSSDEPASTPSESGSTETPAPEGTADAPAPPSMDSTTSDPASKTPTTTQPVVAAENGLDLKYITEDFTSALIIHPSRILADPLVPSLEEAGVPISQGLEEVIQNTGVDPKTIAQVIVLGDKDSTEAASMMGPSLFGFGGGPPQFEEVAPQLEGPPEGFPEPEKNEEEKIPDESRLDSTTQELQPVNFQPQFGDGPGEDFGPGPGPGGPMMGPPPAPTVIIRFTMDVDPATYFENLPVPPLEETEVDGMSVKKIPDPNLDGVFYFADNRTLIFTKSTLLKKMVDAKSTKSPLLTELQQVDASNDLIMVIDMTPLREMIAGLGALMAMGGEGEPNPDLALALKVVSELQTITITAGVSADSLLSLSLVGDSAETMAQANKKLDEFAQMGRGLYQMQKGQMLQREAGLDASGKEFVLAMSDEIVAGISNTADGARLTVSIPKPAKLTELPAVLKPMLDQAQRAPIRMQKKNNLKMIALAFHNYHDTHRGFPGAGSDHSGDVKGLSWRVHLLPYLDYLALYEQFHLDEPWDSEHNASLIAQMPDVFKSPEVTEEGKTAIHVFAGKGTAFEGETGLKISSFTDGTSNTILTIEASPEAAEFWTKPGGLPNDDEKLLDAFKTPYSYGFMYGRADGSVHIVENLTEKLETFKALITRNGGEVVNDF